jgi:hypothetical protein
MRAQEFENIQDSKKTFTEMFTHFLTLAMDILNIKTLPKFKFQDSIESHDQPTFGMYVNDDNTLHVALANRHPVDILRTIAHELVHYRQDIHKMLNHDSGTTGSPEENQANSVAGVIMRHFNKKYPEYLKSKPVIAESAGDRGDIPTGPGEQLIPFPQGTTMVDVSDVYDWYKLGMVISDLDDADPKMFGQGAPHTVIAFGSEEEEHKLLPLLKRLGLSVHDIDRPEDVKQAIPAKMFAKDLAETIRKKNENVDVAEDETKQVEERKKKKKFRHAAYGPGPYGWYGYDAGYSGDSGGDGGVEENFADGRNPQDKGDSARHGIRKGMTIAQLKKVRSSDSASPRKKQLAHWQINMRQGRKK